MHEKNRHYRLHETCPLHDYQNSLVARLIGNRTWQSNNW